MLAGFRFFPSYIRVGGLREDIPRGFKEAVDRVPRSLPRQARRVRDAHHQEPDLARSHARRRRHHAAGLLRWGLYGPIARAAGGDYDVRRAFPYTGYDTFEFDVIGASNGDVYDRYLVRMAEMRESVKICRQALERITPIGEWAVNDRRIVPPPKDEVYTEMEALIQHFLIYSQGFTVPAGEAYVPVEGAARRARLLRRLGRQQPAVARAHALAGPHGLPGAAQVHRRRHDRGRHRGDRLARCRHGRRGSMSFHPAMPYGTGEWHRSQRQTLPEGPDFQYTPENRQRFEEFAAHYPPEHRKSAILHALYLVQEQQGYISGERGASRRRGGRHLDGRRRGRRVVLRDVLPQPGRHVRAAGVQHAVVRAGRIGARDRRARAEARHQGRRDRSDRHVHHSAVRVPRRLRSRAGGDGEQRPLARRAEARGRPARASIASRPRASRRCTGCHLDIEHQPESEWKGKTTTPGEAEGDAGLRAGAHQVRVHAERLHARSLSEEPAGLRGPEESARA